MLINYLCISIMRKCVRSVIILLKKKKYYKKEFIIMTENIGVENDVNTV